MTSKIRIKLGPIEVEYEGSEDFLKKELPELLEAVSRLYKESGPDIADGRGDGGHGVGRGATRGTSFTGTTTTIAAKLGGGQGSDLIMAAAAQLTFVHGKEEFTSGELRAACREAKSLWKKSYRNNFTNYVGRLVADHSLNELRPGVYAISAKKRSALEATLAAA